MVRSGYNYDGSIIEIRRTYFSSEVSGPIMTAETKNDSKWIEGAWVNSEVIAPTE